MFLAEKPGAVLIKKRYNNCTLVSLIPFGKTLLSSVRACNKLEIVMFDEVYS